MSLFVLNANVLRLDEDRCQRRSGISFWTWKYRGWQMSSGAQLAMSSTQKGQPRGNSLFPASSAFYRNEQVAALSRTKTGPGSVVRHGNTDAHEIRRPHAPNTVKSQQSDLAAMFDSHWLHRLDAAQVFPLTFRIHEIWSYLSRANNNTNNTIRRPVTGITSSSGKARETSFLYQRVSVLVQRYNAVRLHDSLPSTDHTDWWSYPNLYIHFLKFSSRDYMYRGFKKIIIIT